ncbi:phosphatidate phosphatase LPIN3-like [Rhinophrynus dorsalis]
MNYVGQLAGSVLGRVRELYREVNPATLTGSIDVVVVRQPDGSFLSSPFHVRFGKLGVLRSAEIGVDIEVNGEPVDLQMRLGENGEAFFIQEMDGTEHPEVPSFSVSSPLLPQGPSPCVDSTDPSVSPHSPLTIISVSDTLSRRQRWSKRRIKKREEGIPGASEEEEGTMPAACESIYYSFSDLPEICSPSEVNEFFPCSEDEVLESEKSQTPSPKSDSELELRPLYSPSSEHCMEWDWGRLPQVNRLELGHQLSQSAPPSPSHREDVPIPSPDVSDQKNHSPPAEDQGKEPPNFATQSDPAKTHDHKASPVPVLAADDALSPDSQEVSLYFPNSEPYPLPPPLQCAGSTVPASTPDLKALETPQEGCVAMSLCGGLADSWDIPEDWFLQHQISYSEFCQNPSLIDDPRLVLRIHNKYYNWAAAAPIILCMKVFNQELPQGVIDQLAQQKMPPKTRGWWFSWRRRDLGPPVTKPQECEEQKEDPKHNRLNKDGEERAEPTIALEKPPTYQKSLRLTSHQISHLNLRSGPNDVLFSVCTKFQGTCRTRAQIFLWDSTDRVVISDIDGTVTRSDTLGHILPQLGKDWTQPGIVQLYHAIHKNGYKFLYCSARSVGLADLTKGYLQRVGDGGCTLPPGPLLLSPSSLFTALHREVIEKTPEHFKISCLSDIRQLFTNPQPFHAAFGNTPNDVCAYKEVGVPESRIFTVNPKGELTQKLNSTFKSSYSALSELVNVMFPPTSSCPVTALLSPEFSQFSFWKDPVPSLSAEDITQVS